MLKVWREGDDQLKWLKHNVEEIQYPPNMIVDIRYDKTVAVSKMINFTLHCSGIQETICSEICNRKICLHADSKWFIDNEDDEWSKYVYNQCTYNSSHSYKADTSSIANDY